MQKQQAVNQGTTHEVIKLLAYVPQNVKQLQKIQTMYILKCPKNPHEKELLPSTDRARRGEDLADLECKRWLSEVFGNSTVWSVWSALASPQKTPPKGCTYSEWFGILSGYLEALKPHKPFLGSSEEAKKYTNKTEKTKGKQHTGKPTEN